MIPIVSPSEMAEIDAAAPEDLQILIARAGWATAAAARDVLGGVYGRRVGVIFGKGNNGSDGRSAARILRRAGVRVVLVAAQDAAGLAGELRDVDLVIDAAYGTGLRDAWEVPDLGSTPVLAVDIPSGVDGLTGQDRGSLQAGSTVTFAALKSGLLLGAGPERSGSVQVADIGLDTAGARSHLVEQSDVGAWLNPRGIDAHKWSAGVRVVAGSPGMVGAAHLVARGAQRGGAGVVVLSCPGVSAVDVGAPVETVVRETTRSSWALEVLADLDRFKCLVVGPGLGRGDTQLAEVRELVGRAPIPVVVDADGLAAFTHHREVLRERLAPTVLTPHDGEYRDITGVDVDIDRFEAARRLASATSSTVLLKGPTTIVADREGSTYAVDEGDQRLATAGSGDVLAGVMAALIAGRPGLAGLRQSVAASAWLHGRSAQLGAAHGLVASDVADGLGDAIGQALETTAGPG